VNSLSASAFDCKNVGLVVLSIFLHVGIMMSQKFQVNKTF